MNDLIEVKKKLNIFHVAIVTMAFISVIALIVTITKFVHIQMMKNENNKYIKFVKMTENKILEEQENERIAREQEEQRQKEEQKKFARLSEDELSNIEKIYKHSEPKRIFLTFDDGPTTQVTPYILDLLKQENIKATFFVLGYRVELNPNLVKREFEEGHFIANHGYSHKYSSIYESTQNVLNEYYKTNDIIKNAIGSQDYNSLVFRFPGGSVGGKYHSLKQEAKQVLKEQGIASVDWNALTKDAEGANTKEKLMQNFYETTNGKTSIVLLMHDAADKILTYEVLPEIISWSRENEYEFKTLYDVIGR